MDGLAVTCTCLALLAAQLFLRHVPTAGGPSIPLLSYIAAYSYARHPEEVLQEGYDKSRCRIVGWGPNGVEDIRRRPDNDLSLIGGFNEILQTEHIMGKEVNENRWHVDVVKTSLTQNLPSILPGLLDELPLAVEDNIRCEDGWTAINVLPAVVNIVARLSSRVFVGLPLCRAPSYLRLAIRFTSARLKDANTLKLIPPVLRPIAACFVNNTRSALVEARAYIEPMIRARRAEMERLGKDWQDRPNDLLQWCIEEASKSHTSDELEAVPPRLFLINFGAIHTSSMSMTNALYDLAAFPEYIAPLRTEVEEVVTADGWTKVAIDKMWKVDSFLRESQRSKIVARVALNRLTTRDLTLNDGTFIPKGTLIATAAAPAHRDNRYYPNADVFDPFRFSRVREDTGASATQAFTHTSAKWFAFGHGKHACPGRFFAADELKALLAYIVLNYDIKADGTPDGSATSTAHTGSKTRVVMGKVLVRKRKADTEGSQSGSSTHLNL
ncbi:cytochrome P450 [Cerioporus squamosus]|nr:cytochrome P450 [Cerioporus squamosus]